MRGAWWLMFVLMVGCAPVATLTPARPATGTGATLGVSAVAAPGERPAVAPYLALYRGDGRREFGLTAQLGVGAYVKQWLGGNVALRVGAGLPGPWYEGSLLLDAPPLTLAGRVVYAPIRWNGRTRALLLGGGSATFWYGDLAAEFSVMAGEGGLLYALSAGYAFSAER